MPRSRHPRWTLARGARFVRSMTPVARALGYRLAVYGSALDGNGRDLDVVAFPWGKGDATRLVDVIVAATGARTLERLRGSGHESAALALPGGRIVDLYVLPARRLRRGT